MDTEKFATALSDVPRTYHDIALYHPDGRAAFIDFSDDGVVKYSGTMPIDDAARIFFDAVAKYKWKDIRGVERLSPSSATE